MIDLHCHILCGIDDGPKDMEESLQLAKAAVAHGIHTLVATPHHHNGTYNNERQDILKQVDELNALLKQEDINLAILPGQETRLYGEFLKDFEAGKIVSINETNKYVLIEFLSNHVPRYAETLIYDMLLQGIIPIIAHPERNSEIIEQPNLLYNLIKKGAMAQLTAASITGDFGKKIKRFSLQLIEHRMAHIIASDAHNTKARPFRLGEAYGVLQKEFGNDALYNFQEAAYAIIGGQSVYRPSPERIKRKKVLGIF